MRLGTVRQVGFGAAAAVLAVGVGVAAAGAGGRVTMCHRTHSTTNPYRRITVSISSVNGSSANDHTHHAGAPFDATYAYPPNAKVWGDVIPDQASGGAGAGLNWTTAGRAAYAAACRAQTAQEFYNAEREAGVDRDAIIADLVDQRADDDDGVDLDDLTYTGSDPSLPDYEGPAPLPSETPSAEPSVAPSVEPSVEPSVAPSVEPSVAPSSEAPAEPTATPEIPPVVPPVVPPVLPPVVPPVVPPVLPPVVPPAPPAVPALTHRVDGVAWLDLDGDGTRDAGEPAVPALPVTATGPRAAMTGADGTFAFAHLPAGAFSVVVHAPPALHVTHDSSGAPDGVADLVLGNAGGHVAVGLAGTGALSVAAPDGPVTVRWLGPDGVLGTADDVVLTAEAVHGVLDLRGLPAGAYVLSAGGATVPVTVLGEKTVRVTVRGASLPRTGTGTAAPLAVGVVLLVAGGVTVLAGGRRRGAAPRRRAAAAGRLRPRGEPRHQPAGRHGS
ncbi:MAG TPA: SdrD B-like domain-containing protein [Mycobacteriales bacterium]